MVGTAQCRAVIAEVLIAVGSHHQDEMIAAGEIAETEDAAGQTHEVEEAGNKRCMTATM